MGTEQSSSPFGSEYFSELSAVYPDLAHDIQTILESRLHLPSDSDEYLGVTRAITAFCRLSSDERLRDMSPQAVAVQGIMLFVAAHSQPSSERLMYVQDDVREVHVLDNLPGTTFYEIRANHAGDTMLDTREAELTVRRVVMQQTDTGAQIAADYAFTCWTEPRTAIFGNTHHVYAIGGATVSTS